MCKPRQAQHYLYNQAVIALARRRSDVLLGPFALLRDGAFYESRQPN